MSFLDDLVSRFSPAPTPARRRGRVTHGGGEGPRFDPARPWMVLGYRGGGGRNKDAMFFASQDKAASALRSNIRRESDPDASYGAGGGRYVFKMAVARSQGELDGLLDYSMSRGEYLQLATKQAMVAPALARRSRSSCGCARR